MPKRFIQLALVLALMSVVMTPFASAQDATALGPSPFWAGAGFVGVFYAERKDELGAMIGGFGYVPIGRVLLGGQGGAVGLGSNEPGGYGLIDVGYFLHTSPTHQFYVLSGVGGGSDPTPFPLLNVGVGLDVLVAPKVTQRWQKGVVVGVRAGSLITAADGGELAGIYLQVAFGGGKRPHRK
jgi:hypothetical protein